MNYQQTLVIQSHTQPPPFSWLQPCIESVESWSRLQDFEYRFYGDELFDLLDPVLVEKFSSQRVILTDLGRLLLIKQCLDQGYDRVLWLDADFLIFAPDQLRLPPLWELAEGYMLGREVWVQKSLKKNNKLSAHVKVHNAFLLFDRGNRFLDFYIAQAERFLHKCEGSVPPQFIGPKLLTALHNVVQCPVMESMGMLSPEVILDLISKGQRSDAVKLMLKRSSAGMAGANLCSSLADGKELSHHQMEMLVEHLIDKGISF